MNENYEINKNKFVFLKYDQNSEEKVLIEFK